MSLGLSRHVSPFKIKDRRITNVTASISTSLLHQETPPCPDNNCQCITQMERESEKKIKLYRWHHCTKCDQLWAISWTITVAAKHLITKSGYRPKWILEGLSKHNLLPRVIHQS